MVRPPKLSAYHTAMALVVNAKLYSADKDREITRFRFSRQMLRSVSGWRRLSEGFLKEVFDELYGLGWTALELSDTELAAIQTSKVTVWPKLGGGRVAATIRKEERSASDTIEMVYEEFFGADEEEVYD